MPYTVGCFPVRCRGPRNVSCREMQQLKCEPSGKGRQRGEKRYWWRGRGTNPSPRPESDFGARPSSSSLRCWEFSVNSLLQQERCKYPARPVRIVAPMNRPATGVRERDSETSQRHRWVAEATAAELARAAQQGDGHACAALYRRAWPRALAAVRASCGWDEAEDAVAEAFARALGRLDQLREPAAVETWLARCAVRAATDLARCRWRAQPAGHATDLPVEAVFAESAADRALSVLDSAAMAEIVGQLPENLRQVIGLRYLAGFSVREVAARLSLPEGTVRRRCFDGCQLVQQRFLHHHLRPATGECAAVTDHLCRGTARALSALAQRRVERHVRGCAPCQARQAELTVALDELSRSGRAGIKAKGRRPAGGVGDLAAAPPSQAQRSHRGPWLAGDCLPLVESSPP